MKNVLKYTFLAIVSLLQTTMYCAASEAFMPKTWQDYKTFTTFKAEDPKGAESFMEYHRNCLKDFKQIKKEMRDLIHEISRIQDQTVVRLSENDCEAFYDSLHKHSDFLKEMCMCHTCLWKNVKTKPLILKLLEKTKQHERITKEKIQRIKFIKNRPEVALPLSQTEKPALKENQQNDNKDETTRRNTHILRFWEAVTSRRIKENTSLFEKLERMEQWFWIEKYNLLSAIDDLKEKIKQEKKPADEMELKRLEKELAEFESNYPEYDRVAELSIDLGKKDGKKNIAPDLCMTERQIEKTVNKLFDEEPKKIYRWTASNIAANPYIATTRGAERVKDERIDYYLNTNQKCQ